MFKKVNFKNLRQDLRKIAVTFIIGGLVGLFLHPGANLISLIALAISGGVIWYFGLRDGGINDD